MSYYCLECQRIKRIISLFNKEKVLDILEQNLFKKDEVKKPMEARRVRFKEPEKNDIKNNLMEELKDKIQNGYVEYHY